MQNETIADRMKAKHEREMAEFQARTARLEAERAPTDPKEGWVPHRSFMGVRHMTFGPCTHRAENAGHDCFTGSDGKIHFRGRIYPTELEALEVCKRHHVDSYEHHRNLANKAHERYTAIKNKIARKQQKEAPRGEA